MKKTQQLIDDYIRCTKTHLIVDESHSKFYLWRPFVQETDNGPFEILQHHSDNESVGFFLELLYDQYGQESDSSHAQHNQVYRFNNLIETSKDLFTDGYLCQTLDSLKIVNISEKRNIAVYSVLFPRERVLYGNQEVERMRKYVEGHFALLQHGQRLFEDDYFKKERERLRHFPITGSPKINKDDSHISLHRPIIELDFDSAMITLSNGEKSATVNLQPLVKSWLIYFIMHPEKPLLYSDILSDKDTLTAYYNHCVAISDQRRGRPKKEGSSLKPGLIVRKINAELEKCCITVGLIPGSVLIVRLGHIPRKQVDVRKMIIGADINVVFPE